MSSFLYVLALAAFFFWLPRLLNKDEVLSQFLRLNAKLGNLYVKKAEQVLAKGNVQMAIDLYDLAERLTRRPELLLRLSRIYSEYKHDPVGAKEPLYRLLELEDVETEIRKKALYALFILHFILDEDEAAYDRFSEMMAFYMSSPKITLLISRSSGCFMK